MQEAVDFDLQVASGGQRLRGIGEVDHHAGPVPPPVPASNHDSDRRVARFTRRVGRTGRGGELLELLIDELAAHAGSDRRGQRARAGDSRGFPATAECCRASDGSPSRESRASCRSSSAAAAAGAACRRATAATSNGSSRLRAARRDRCRARSLRSRCRASSDSLADARQRAQPAEHLNPDTAGRHVQRRLLAAQVCVSISGTAMSIDFFGDKRLRRSGSFDLRHARRPRAALAPAA